MAKYLFLYSPAMLSAWRNRKNVWASRAMLIAARVLRPPGRCKHLRACCRPEPCLCILGGNSLHLLTGAPEIFFPAFQFSPQNWLKPKIIKTFSRAILHWNHFPLPILTRRNLTQADRW